MDINERELTWRVKLVLQRLNCARLSAAYASPQHYTFVSGSKRNLMRVAPRCSCVARLRWCARSIIQCFGRSAGSERQLLRNKPFFLQWHACVSYCGVIPLNMESLEEAVVVLPFVLIPCSSLHCARVFRRG